MCLSLIWQNVGAARVAVRVIEGRAVIVDREGVVAAVGIGVRRPFRLPLRGDLVASVDPGSTPGSTRLVVGPWTGTGETEIGGPLAARPALIRSGRRPGPCELRISTHSSWA